MSDSAPLFEFASQYQRWYTRKYDDASGQWEYHWQPAGWNPKQQPPLAPLSTTHIMRDSDYSGTVALGPSPYPSAKSVNVPPAAPYSPWRPSQPRGLGRHVIGTYESSSRSRADNLQYEELDPLYCVRDKRFYREGRVFAIILSEAAGSTITSYNSSISEVKFPGHYVHTQIRRFVVVRAKREFCFACPIFTYQGRGTTKRGVRPEEHGIAYSLGQVPQLLTGETGIRKPSIAVQMAKGEQPLQISSRIYYGIHHPIQYNVRVREIGSVRDEDIPKLIGSWKEESIGESSQDLDVTANAEEPDTTMSNVFDEMEVDRVPHHSDDYHQGNAMESLSNQTDLDQKRSGKDDSEQGNKQMDIGMGNPTISLVSRPSPSGALTKLSSPLDSTYEPARNPTAFFKKGRVFMTPWAEPGGFSDQPFVEIARFAVVKPNPTFSVCLRISTYSGQGTTKPGVASHHHAAVIPLGGTAVMHKQGESLVKEAIEVKVEEANITIDPMSRINFAKPYTVEHNIKIRNIGRVVGESVGRLDKYFAESLGHTKS